MRPCHLLTVPALLVGLITCPARAADGPRPIDSTITHVTVYPEWAYVTRSAQVDLPAGVSRLGLEALPAWIDSESIRVTLGDADGLRLEGARTETTFLARSTEDDANKAEAAVTRLNDRIEDLNNQLAVLKEERQYLRELKVYSVDATPKDAAVRDVSTEEMAKVQNYLKEQMLANVRAITETKRQIRDLQPDLAAAKKNWNEVKGRVRLEQKRILIDLTADQPTKTTLEVGYLISGASWYPAYDARTTSANGELDLNARAVVQQSTGEDWADASFTLSTIQPYLSREIPELKPWVIGDRVGLGLDNGESLSQPTYIDARGDNRIARERLQSVRQKQFDWNAINAPAQAAYACVVTNKDRLFRVLRTVEERGTTVEFHVAGRHSVTADGKPAELPLGQTTFQTTHHYTAAPAVSRATYITAKIRNTGAFPVLPGEVRIYTDGSFVAKSTLPFVAQNEKFDLFLGLEERIKVTRTLDYARSSTASWSNKKRLSAAYVIEVKNYRDNPITIDIADQVPISEDKRVVVKVEEIEPKAGSVDKGIITWPVALGAGESKALRFAFRIDYPPATLAAPLPDVLHRLEMQIDMSK